MAILKSCLSNIFGSGFAKDRSDGARTRKSTWITYVESRVQPRVHHAENRRSGSNVGPRRRRASLVFSCGDPCRLLIFRSSEPGARWFESTRPDQFLSLTYALVP